VNSGKRFGPSASSAIAAKKAIWTGLTNDMQA
jgi:hypothetical protein